MDDSAPRALPWWQRGLALGIVAFVPAELALVTHLARGGREHVLAAAAATDIVLLAGAALLLLLRAGHRVPRGRALRLFFIAVALFYAAARVLRLDLPPIFALLSLGGEITILVLVASGSRAVAKALPRPVAALLDTELSILAAATRAISRRPLPAVEGAFTTVRSSELGRLYFGLALITLCELPAVHLLLHAWLGSGRPMPHVALAAVHVYGLVWLLGDWRLLAETGHRIDGGCFEVRLGGRWRGQVPLALVEAAIPLSESKRTRGDLSPLEPANVCLALRSPVELAGSFGIRREVDRLRLRVDDPAGLVEALRASLAPAVAHGPGQGKASSS
jgi:hypothetical protein